MSTLRKLACAFFLSLAASAPAAAVERILLFVSDVMVQRNGDLDVTETIRVQAEGNEIRRGILRDFPTIYTRNDGTGVEVGFTVQSVMRDGTPENWATESLNNGVRVRVGSADRTLATGPHEYVIKYRTTRQIGFFPGYDELYWNVTGVGWTFAIDQAEARITLPAQVPFRQAAFYTGPQNGQGKDATIVEQRPGHIVFRTTKALPPRNGLAVAAAWEKGVVDAPTASQKGAMWLSDNLAVPVALGGLILVLGYYFYAWLRVGRDPPRGTVIPLFGPPDGMSAAAVRYVENMSFDQRCFTAAIITLGVAGHLKIDGAYKTPVLERRDGGKPIPAAEEAMQKRLFENQPSLVLSKTNHEPLGKAKTALMNGLSAVYRGKLFVNNFGWSGLGLLASALLIAAVCVAVYMTHTSDQAGAIIAGMLIPVLFIMGGVGMICNAFKGEHTRLGLLIGGILVAGIPAAIGFVIVAVGARGPIDMLPLIGPFGVASIAGVAFSLLQAPTVAGRKVMDQIEGFRQYLGVAEEDRLNALNPPDKTPELFERFLPYAVALDVENVWAKRFAGVLAAAGVAAATNAWYAGDQNWRDDPVGFADHLGSDLSNTIAAASTPPGSTDSGGGSSGGGSSSGGGGGGGGSGW